MVALNHTNFYHIFVCIFPTGKLDLGLGDCQAAPCQAWYLIPCAGLCVVVTPTVMINTILAHSSMITGTQAKEGTEEHTEHTQGTDVMDLTM